VDNAAGQLGGAFQEVNCVRPSGGGPVVMKDASVAADYVASQPGHYEPQVTRPKLVGWGQTRLQQLEHELDQADTVWPGPSLAEAYATLRAWCVKAGHGLGQKAHEADRWVAATAIWLNVPLVAHDAIFANVKDLRLLTSPISVSRDRVLLCSVPVPSDADQDRQTTPTSEKRKRRSSVQWQVS
jgi:hypothetical protein